jgi:serine/threonine protein kinase
MNRSRLLLIDRDCALRLMIESHLRRLDRFEVETADDAAAGIERARLGRFDLVLASLDLPGAPPARLLDALSLIRPAPALIATGLPATIDALDGARAGAVLEVLRLPFSRSTLADVVLRARRQQQEHLCRSVIPAAPKPRHQGSTRRKGGGAPVRLGHYEVSALLGAGPKGAVYRGLDKRSGGVVALRALPRDLVERLGGGSRWFERFTREASAAASVNHPNLSALLDHGFEEDQQCLFVVSEHAQGLSLSAKLSDKGRLPAAEAVTMACHVSNALAAVHAGGFAHRLVRPTNIIVDDEGRATLTDLGIANMLAWDLMPLRQRLDRTPYLSPEQVRLGHVDDRSDQFSLGLVLHEALTGRHCFKGKSPSAKVLEMSRRRAHLSLQDDLAHRDELTEVLQRMLAPDPDERFQGDAELKAALQGCAKSFGLEV